MFAILWKVIKRRTKVFNSFNNYKYPLRFEECINFETRNFVDKKIFEKSTIVQSLNSFAIAA